ncbi:MAG: insulinase family protein [Pseudomonadota bacterium]|nr:insulinase family protein [Pseudomonadota bacterium]QKK05270.1 MAG: insulinase family protein [Pseudomonadota bacterium]
MTTQTAETHPAHAWKKSPFSWVLVGIAIFSLIIGFVFLQKTATTPQSAVPSKLAKMLKDGAETPQHKSRVPIEEVTSPGGLKAWLVNDSSVPVISIDFSFPGGMTLEDPAAAGLSNMMSIMLDEGAGSYDSQAFQKELADHVISLSFSAGRDRFFGSVKTLKKYQDKAFALTHLALTQPRFEEDALARMKRATLNSIRQNLGNPGWTTARLFNGTIFAGHPYERPGQGNPATVEKITAADLKALAQKQFVREGLQISVAGDISAEELAAKLDDIFGGLQKGTPAEEKEHKSALNEKALGKTYVYHMEIPQSIIQFAHQGISPQDDDYMAAGVMNYILGGGGFASRLMTSLREEHGLTYGIYTQLSDSDAASLLQGQFATTNDSAGKAVALLKEEWARLAKDGPTEEELRLAKNYLIGSFPLALTSSDAISGMLSGLQKNKRDIDYINRYADMLRAVTKDDVKRVAERLLNADDLSFVIVGKPEGIENAVTVTKLPGM